ncbi:MAG: hypothetical protein K6G84_05880 [Lachnospiraceae bacterium]|nr:hypothetical protein [Lachnospiraceae bacterium]
MSKGDKDAPKKVKRNNYRGMTKVIIMRVIPALVVIVFLIFFAIFTFMRSSCRKQIIERMTSESESAANRVQVWSNGALEIINIFGDLIESGHLGSNEDIVNYVTRYKKDIIPGSNGLYVIYNDDKGTTLSYDGEETFPEYLSEEWFKFGLGCDKTDFDACSWFLEDDTERYSVTCTKNIKDSNGNFVGIVASDLHFDVVKEHIEEECAKLNSKFYL